MHNFAGKEYDTVTLVPSYVVSSLIVGAMDTDDRYPVSADTQIALLQNTKKNEVVQMFHALDVNRVIETLEKRGVIIDFGNSPATASRGMTSFIGHHTVTFELGDYKVSFAVISFLDRSTGRLCRIADIENVTINAYRKDDEGQWEEVGYRHAIGFKKNEPTDFFTEELAHLLKMYDQS